MGFIDEVTGRMVCPECQNKLDTAASTYLLCCKCRNYFERVGGSLQRVEDGRIAREPVFGVTTPWKEVHSVTYPAIALPMVALTDAMLTGRKGMRMVQATWPDSCALCDGAATRKERIAKVVFYPREWGILNLGTNKVTVVADVPHCGTHAGGVSLERFEYADSSKFTLFGLVFRWLGYRNAFLRLNRWEWLNV